MDSILNKMEDSVGGDVELPEQDELVSAIKSRERAKPFDFEPNEDAFEDNEAQDEDEKDDEEPVNDHSDEEIQNDNDEPKEQFEFENDGEGFDEEPIEEVE